MKLMHHLLKRSGERNFYPEMLVKILSGNHILLPSDKDPSAELIIGAVDDKVWTVVVNVETETVITARRAHGKEVKKYEETFKK